ncbi:hypothetical protein FoTM2_014198, partial [Fusarium oxysporum f. sp. vasinfectum]
LLQNISSKIGDDCPIGHRSFLQVASPATLQQGWYTKLSSYHFDSADQMKSLVGRNILFSSSDDGNATRISRDIGMAAYARSSLCPRVKTIATRLLTAKLESDVSEAILSEKTMGMNRPICELTTRWCLFKRK